jgi:rubrerythrin
MDIYEYAMQMEKDGEAYYRDVVLKTEHKGTRSILTMLADAEAAHYHIFKQLKENEKIPLEPSTNLAQVKNVFQQIAESKDFSLLKPSEIDVYKTAQGIEQKSIKLYEEQASLAGEGHSRDVFRRIADEERKHYLVLEKLIDFVSQPDQWLENPEWYHLEDY